MNSSERSEDLLVWVLAPMIETTDPNLLYYYDYTQSKAEYEKVFSDIGCEWIWREVTFPQIEATIRDITNHPTSKTKLVINLCDGDEANGIPGVSVIDQLEEADLMYTGSDHHFYDITTSKIPMKVAFDQWGVTTPPWKELNGKAVSFNELKKKVGDTIIVKPAISAGSMGLTVRNVVTNENEYEAVMNELGKGYHGWKLDTGGALAEQFIAGREFTTLIVGSSNDLESLHVYPPAERVFHESLPEREQFLSFDRLWETFDKESPMPEKASLYSYYQPGNEIVKKLEKITIEAFRSVGGMGYGRLDIRMDKATGTLYVLEVNAQCGLSEDENYTSIGAILRFARKTFTSLIIEIMEDAMKRYEAKHKARQ